MSEEESTDAPLYTDAEVRAAVEEATIWGRKLAAHAHGADGIKRAVRAGGSDGADMPAGENAKQFRDYVAWGMSPMDAIFTATRNAAELLGISDQVGAIRVGMHADIIAIRGDVLQHPEQLEHVIFVMKDGRIFKR